MFGSVTHLWPALTLGLLACATTPPARQNADGDTPAAGCDEDTRVCDDGSVVARSGPQCEFAACPESDEPIDGGFSPDPAPAGPDGDVTPQPMGTFEVPTDPSPQ